MGALGASRHGRLCARAPPPVLGDLALLPCWGAWGPEGRRVARADDAIMIAHHALSIAIWPMTVYYNYCSRYVLIMISTEFSSIFMTCNWFLTTLGRKSDLIYKVNGLIFTLTFVVVRMVGAVPQLVAMFRVPPWTMSTMRAVAPDVDIQWWQVYACSAMVLPHCLNLFWGVKVIKGYLKVHNAYFEARRKGRADGKKKT
ncbi:unnamed protein product [Prorocentrum cordatum]|uniref:TLC domain-containing protein n=1 Tax=Prorocentrum cordatum TaxID=2364126 RepID=A0ABN9RRR4_9DINO|nr:unnamed protein product [Polarella glacialis]